MRESLARFVHPILEFAFEVHDKLRQGEELDLEQVQAVLKGLLSVEPQAPACADAGAGPGDPTPAERFLGLQFPLVCWLDEFFLTRTPWRGEWNQRTLEWAVYGTRLRAETFWSQARLADVRLGGDALEVFLLCVALGFRGVMRESPGRLAAWMRAAQARIAARQQRPPRPAAVESPAPLPRLRGDAGWLWWLLGPAEQGTASTEIDQAWQEAHGALIEAGVDPARAPLFLVLGRSEGGEEALLEAALPGAPRLCVRGVPARPESPLRVFASRDAIYVTCAGAGLLAKQAELLAREPRAEGGPLQAIQDSQEHAFATIGVSESQCQGGPLALLARARRAARPARPRRPWPWQAADLEQAEGRLRRLVRLLARDRPGPPLNGVLVLLPWSATQDDEAAIYTGLSARRDLAAVHEAARLQFPAVALVCDLEQAPGFAAFAGRFSADRRHDRLGQSVSWLAGAERPGLLRQITDGVRRVCDDLIPACVHQSWQWEAVEGDDLEQTLMDNRRLYGFWCEVARRQERLIALVSACAGTDDGPKRSWFAGCYLAGTGSDQACGRAFVAGVFDRLYELRRHLSWAPEAIDEDRTYRRWSRWTAGALGVLAAAVALLWWVV
jgi:type VI secretion system protein ImpK